MSVYESKQTILNPEVAAVHYTLLLVDLSGSITQSGAMEQLKPAVQSFADRVGSLQKLPSTGSTAARKSSRSSVLPMVKVVSVPRQSGWLRSKAAIHRPT